MSRALVEFRLRRDDGSWSTNNTVLGPGEPGVSGHSLGIGDGHTGWNELPKYFDETLAGAPDPEVLAEAIDDYMVENVNPVIAALTARVLALEEAPPPVIPEGFEIIDLDAEAPTFVVPLLKLGVFLEGAVAQLILGDGVKTVTEHKGNVFTPNATRIFAPIQRNYGWAQGAVDAWNNGNNVLPRIAALEGGG